MQQVDPRTPQVRPALQELPDASLLSTNEPAGARVQAVALLLPQIQCTQRWTAVPEPPL